MYREEQGSNSIGIVGRKFISWKKNPKIFASFKLSIGKRQSLKPSRCESEGAAAS
jgi:hypothetical protein